MARSYARFPDAGGGPLRARSPHVLPSPPTPSAAAALVTPGSRRAGRERRLDRLRQGRRRLALDRRRRAPVPRHRDRRLQRRLPGRRRHDDRPQRRPPAPARPPRARARRLRHPGQRHAAGARQDVLRAFRSRPLPGRHEGRLHVLLHDPEPEPDLLPAHVRDHDQRGRHRLLARRPPDRVGRAGPRQALRLAQPVVGRQRHRDDQRPDAPAEPRRDHRHDQRRRHGQPRQELVQRHRRRQPAHERRRHHARPHQARVRHRRERQHADDLQRPAVPDALQGRRRRPRLQADRLLPLQRAQRRGVLDPDVRARRQPRRVGRGRRHPRRDRPELRAAAARPTAPRRPRRC